METNWFRVLFLCVLYLVTFPTLQASIEHFDEYWQKRAKEAKQDAEVAAHPKPAEVTHDFHENVNAVNNTRRGLRAKYTGPCLATNPIDSCWRCDPNWANNRKKLADCVLGFAKGTTGGKDGKFYEVTDASDNDLVHPKPGTLRHAVLQPGPLWITFAHDMTIKLTEELLVTSDKTIDGRGAHVQICHGAQITLQFVKNVIIHGLRIHDTKKGKGGTIRDSPNHFGIRGPSDGDGISMFGASKVWIDHVSMWNCADGLIDGVMASTAITISNCHFTKHNDVMLFGASDTYSADKVMQVTIAYNHFGEGLIQRMPRCRWGFFHVVNNDYTHWIMYAIGGSKNPTIISQGNRFNAPMNRAAKEVTKRDYASESEWKNWNWRSEVDEMKNGAFFVQSGSPVTLPKEEMAPRPGIEVGELTRFSGFLNCKAGKPC